MFVKATSLTKSSRSAFLGLGRFSSTGAALADDDVYDVVVVGAGMVGAALSSLIGSHPITKNLKIALVDHQQAPTAEWSAPAVPEARVSTITPASISCLAQAGAWNDLCPPHSVAFSSMQVWDTAGPGFIRWHTCPPDHPSSSSDHSSFSHPTSSHPLPDTMGVVVENSLLQSALLRSAQHQCGDLSMMWGTSVSNLLLPRYTPGGMGAAATAAAHADEQRRQQRQQGSGGSSGGGSGGGGSSGGEGSGHGLAQVVVTGGDGAAAGGGRVLRARLVVGADGANSRLRGMAGLRTLDRDYHQRGVVATVRLEEPSPTAWQRFLPTGPLALLPVRDGYSNVVWSTTPQMAAQLSAMTPSRFADAVNAALNDPSDPASSIPFRGAGLLEPLRAMLQHPMTGSLDSLFGLGSGYDGRSEFQPPPRVLGWEGAPPRSFPLVARQSGRYVRQRFALVGDAAHSIHPMAGQGVNLGFADVECLAAALVMATKTGADIGDERVLQELYQDPRQAANLSMAATLDTLQRVFRVEGSPFALLRSLGMGALNVSGPVKDRIMRYAMGL
ncbi:MAG: hypothetical protein WDW36_007693 [Sanguina aurantia]